MGTQKDSKLTYLFFSAMLIFCSWMAHEVVQGKSDVAALKEAVQDIREILRRGR